MYFVFLILLLILNKSAHSTQWFCKEGSSKRFDNTFEVCGIGSDLNEDIARKKALSSAFNEFDLVCNKSDDCKGKYKQVSPLRTDCEKDSDKFNCYRAFYIVIDPTKERINKEDEYLYRELENKEKEILEVQSKYGVIIAEKIKLEKENNMIKEENILLKEKIDESSKLIEENKNFKERLKKLTIASNKIRSNIKAVIQKERSLINLVKAGMSTSEVDNILGTEFNNEDLGKYEEKIFEYGTYIKYYLVFNGDYKFKILSRISYCIKIGVQSCYDYTDERKELNIKP